MSTHLVNFFENSDVISQEFRIRRGITLHSFGLKLYRGVLTEGSLVINIKQDSTILWTKTVNYTDLNNATTNDYGFGYFNFEADNLQLNGRKNGEEYATYTIEVNMGSYSGADLIGWAKEDYSGTSKNGSYGLAEGDNSRPYSFKITRYTK